jgi:two-component system phosphate regulon sensor histidine kinase PhoR
VKWNWSRLRRFWLEEEVPRWIGLSLVLVYVAGLGAVGYATFRDSCDAARKALHHTTEHSAGLLAAVLSTIDPADAGAQQRALRAFASSTACEQLRIYNRDATVLASIDADEIGHPNSATPQLGTTRPLRMEVHPLLSAGAEGRMLFRAPIAAAPASDGATDPGGGDALSSPDRMPRRIASSLRRAPERFLEGVINVSPPIGGATGGNSALLITLLATGVLFLLYRSLRHHLRGIWQISENLTAHRALETPGVRARADLLATELASLRVADSLGAIAEQWNRLIDFAEQLRAEAQRAAAASELRQVLERTGSSELAVALNAVPDGILHVVDERRVAYANTSACRLLGVAPEDEALEDIDALSAPTAAGGATVPARAPVVELLRAARMSNGNYAPRSETVHVEVDGSSYRVRVLPLRETRRHGECVVTIADVSQQVRADRAREDFVSQVTHELRTPLTNIRAYAETLSSGVFEDPRVITECYNVITKETRRLSRLIEDILSISQIEVGSIRLVHDDVDLRTLLTDAVRDVRGLAEEKKIDLQLVLPAKLEPMRADRDKLAVVINNLLGNALKYTPSGGEVHVGCKSTAEKVMITVKDNGIGIPPEEHERVFEKFQRGSDPRVASEPGTGIGLTTAREIARRHGGDIELMSAAGQGSTFVVTLPRARSGPAEAVTQASGAMRKAIRTAAEPSSKS